MCKTKASTDVSTPAAVAAVVLAGAAISSAAAVITSVLVAVLVTMLVLSAAGITGLIILLRRERVGLWRPVPARPAAARPARARAARARAALATEPVIALPVPSMLAIEGPSVINGLVLADMVAVEGVRETSREREMAAART